MTIKVLLENRTNSNPDFGPLGIIGKLASFRLPYPDGVTDCPLGRGKDKVAALSDLFRRAGMDTTSVMLVDLDITER
jgi:hypothetical protein